MSNKVKEKKVETREVELEENCSKNKASFHNNDIKDRCSTPKEKKEKDKKDHGKEEKTCTECSYVYNKETTLKKHMIAKHEEHQCKECHLKLSTFMELLKHIANEHCKEQCEEQGIEYEDDELNKLEELLVNKNE